MDNLKLPEELTNIKNFYQWESFKVTNEGEMQLAGQALAEIANRLKIIDTKRKEVTGPIKKGIKAFEDMCKNVTGPLEKIDSILRGKVTSFMNQRQKLLEDKAREEREAALAIERQKTAEALSIAMETGSETAAEEVVQRNKNLERLSVKPITASQTVRTNSFTMAQQQVWTWKITDLSKVPREYLVVNELELNKLARSFSKLEKKPEIPGITFQQESRVSIRR